jgi:cation diffusion facilitator CzcD-associated flavoprotein CzcO
MQQLDYDIAIIGAGFAGLGMAIRLKKAGYNSFVIFERGNEVGGTWRDNTYPGCGCDVASHLYSFSFEPNPKWSLQFSKQPEILAYLKDCVRKNNLEPHLHLNTEILDVIFNESEGFYTIKDSSGKLTTARMVVAGLGPLNRPQIPDFEGLDSFKGEIFHSSNWNHDYDLTGKRVASIGTGASTIQFVPEIVDKVSQLYVFQRTAPWIMPKYDSEFSNFAKSIFEKLPFIRKAYRGLLYRLNEFAGLSFVGNKTIRKLVQSQATQQLKKQVKDPELLKKLTPPYQIGCKRILVSNDFYPALQKPNTELVTDKIKRITEDGIITENGAKIEVDTIIFGTGFYVAEYPEKFIKDRTIQGLGGANLFQKWTKEGFEAYKGTTINGFPNLMFVLGPNTGLGHNTVVDIMESQINYIMDFYEKLLKKSPKTYFNIKPEVQKAYNEKIQSMFKNTAWASGCGSYYINSGGKNTTIYPRLNTEFRKQTLRVDLEEYEVLVGD